VVTGIVYCDIIRKTVFIIDVVYLLEYREIVMQIDIDAEEHGFREILI